MSWYASLVLLLCRCQRPRQVFAASSRGLGLSHSTASLEWPPVSDSGNFVYLDGSDIFWRKRTRSVFSSKQKKTSVHENVNNFFSQFHHEAAAANKYSEMQLEALLLRFHSPLIKQLFFFCSFWEPRLWHLRRLCRRQRRRRRRRWKMQRPDKKEPLKRKLDSEAEISRKRIAEMFRYQATRGSLVQGTLIFWHWQWQHYNLL